MENILTKTKINKGETSKTLDGDTMMYELLETVNKFISCDDLKNASFYINIAKLFNVSDLISKVSILTLDSIIKFKTKNQDGLLKITRKVMKYLNKNTINYPTHIISLFIKILFKTAQAHEENENILIPCWLYYLSKNMYDSQEINTEDSTHTIIKSKIQIFLRKITEKLSIVRNDITQKKSTLQIIKNLFKNNSLSISLNKPNESFFLVSTHWITNMVMFVDAYLDNKKDDEVSALFNTNNVCILYFSCEEDEEYRKEIEGTYPGQMNNFSLMGSSEFWNDPEEIFTNIYLNKKFSENKDYLILTQDIYHNIKNCFGVFNEIERRSVFNEENLEIEINLTKIKIIFINEQLRDYSKDLIAIKYIQMSKFTTFKQFEQKIHRTFKNLLANNKIDSENDYDFKFFKFESDIREMFDLVIAYINKTKFFKINVNELKRSDYDNKNISDLHLKDESMVVIEAIPKNMIMKPFIRIKIESINCSYCNSIIKENKIYCNDCSQNVYCSEKCRSSDTAHDEFHQKLAIQSKTKLNLEEISKINISTYLEADSKGGLVGLRNLDGSSTFINSALQCLSHCEDLTKYFLSKSFISDMNQNRFGMEGKVAIAYSSLITELWLGKNSEISPFEITNIFTSFMKQFSSSSQDSVEMVLFILNRLHEDLNKNKAFVINDKKDSEEISPDSWIQSYKAKKNSVISDLFLGSLKKTYTCSKCNNSQIFYEPFFHLSLEIPEVKNNKIKFKVFPNNYDYNFFLVELYEVTKKTLVNHIKKKIRENKAYKKKEFDAVLFKNKSIECILADTDTIYDLIFTKIEFSDEEFIDYEILFYEVENSSQSKNKGDFVTFYVTPSEFYEEKYYYFITKSLHRTLTYPKAFSISKKSRVKDLYIEVYKYYRRIMDDKVIKEEEDKTDTSYYKYFYENKDNKEFIDKDFDKNYSKLDPLKEIENEQLNYEDDTNIDNKEKLFELFFLNNIPNSEKFFFFKTSCEFCKTKCNNCRLKFSLNSTIYELYATQQISREFLILADFTKFKDNCHKFYEEYYDFNDPRNMMKGDLSIYDCLDNFQRVEPIVKEKEKEVEWNCGICQSKRTEAFKKVEINSLPKYLIVQIKRFKFRGHTSLLDLVNNKKKDECIDFPLNNFDLTNFVSQNSNEIKKSYDLFAISRHSGSMKGGNFTSIVNNRGKWHELNDEIVQQADMSEVIDSRAYLLFYRLVDEDESTSING